MAGTLGYKFKPGVADAVSLSAVTTGTGKAIPMQDCRHTFWTIEGTGAISAGTVIIETADRQDYAGVWHALDTKTASELSDAVGKSYVNNTVGAGSGFIRARIGTTISGGTVTVRINGLLA